MGGTNLYHNNNLQKLYAQKNIKKIKLINQKNIKRGTKSLKPPSESQI